MIKTITKKSDKKIYISQSKNTKNKNQDFVRSRNDTRGSREIFGDSNREGRYKFDVNALDSLFDSAIG